jgi:hypothetical protein
MNARLGVLTVLVAVCLSSAQAREWKDTSGKFSVEAEFVGHSEGNVQLRRADGTVITVALDRLSEKDRAFIQSLTSKNSESQQRHQREAEHSTTGTRSPDTRNDTALVQESPSSPMSNQQGETPRATTKDESTTAKTTPGEKLATVLSPTQYTRGSAGIRDKYFRVVDKKVGVLFRELPSSVAPLSHEFAESATVVALTQKVDTRTVRGWPWRWTYIFISLLALGLLGIVWATLAKRFSIKHEDSKQFIAGAIVSVLGFIGSISSVGLFSISDDLEESRQDGIHFDNATSNACVVTLDRQEIVLPPLSHRCLRPSAGKYELTIRDQLTGNVIEKCTIDIAPTGIHVFNVEAANSYDVKVGKYR